MDKYILRKFINKKFKLSFNALLCIAFLLKSSNSFSTDVGNLLLGNAQEKTPLDFTQSIKNTPGLITTISASDIEKYQYKTFAEVLKYVPGFRVREVDAQKIRVSYHDNSMLHVQLLINGQAQHGGVRSLNLWEQFPIPLGQIENIKIYRSPAAVHFGSNAFNAVIDVTTKKPINSQNSLVINGETDGSFSGSGANIYESGKHTSATYLTFSSDAGFEDRIDSVSENEDPERLESTSKPGDAYMISGRTEYKYRDLDLFFDINFQYSVTQLNDTAVSPPPALPADVRKERYVLSSMTEKSVGNHTHRLKVSATRWKNEEVFQGASQRWLLWSETNQLYQQNPAYIQSIINGIPPSGGTASDDQLRDIILFRLATESNAFDLLTGDLNNNYIDDFFKLNYADTINLNSYTTLQVGLSYEKTKTESETFFDNVAQSEKLGHHLYSEINLNPFVINVGYHSERASNVGSQFFTSPLLGINYYQSNTDTIKFLYAKSNRSPDLVYTNLDWQYTARNISSPVDGLTEAQFFLNPNSKNEKFTAEENESIQLVYVRDLNKTKIEAGAYYEERENILFSFFNYFDFSFDSADIITHGIEFLVEHNLTSQQDIRLILNYNDYKTSSVAERLFLPTWSGSFQYARVVNDINFSANIGVTQYSFYDDFFASISLVKSYVNNASVGFSLNYDNDYEYDFNGVDGDVAQFEVQKRKDEITGLISLKYNF